MKYYDEGMHIKAIRNLVNTVEHMPFNGQQNFKLNVAVGVFKLTEKSGRQTH